MKSLLYLLLALILITTHGCKEEDHPYVGYIKVGRAVIEGAAGSTTITADTDISETIIVEVDKANAEWCTASSNGKEITITAQANPSNESFRTATVNVRCGYRVTTFTVLQKFAGQQYLEYDWTGWTAKGSDVQASDGGGFTSLFKDDRTNFWHSQYSPALDNPLPHWIIVDMKKELAVSMVSVGRRHYAPNGNNYPTVKTMEVYASVNDVDYTKVGGFTFALPWTAPNGTVVNGNSPLVPGAEDIMLSETVTARYIKLVITETNNTTGVCQVSFFKAYEKI